MIKYIHQLHYYPFGMPMPGRSLNKQICTDVSQATLVTDLDNTFTGSTEGYSGIASTLSAGGNALLVTKNSGTHTFGASKTFTITQSGTNHMLGFEVTQFAVGTNISVLCKIDGNTVATITGITSQSISIGTLSTGNHTLSFETNNSIGGNRSFTIDNIEITYDVTTITTTCVDAVDYRYGFNGMEKDEEVKGEGNSLDFGARIYDSRLGRWLSVDPLYRKYSHMSPYLFAGGSPLIFKDIDGNENVIYLYDLNLNKPNLTKEEKNKILARLNDIASQVNNGFKEKGLTPRAVVVTSPEYKKIIRADQLNQSDVLATIGNTDQLLVEQERLEGLGFDKISIEGMGEERSSEKLDGKAGNRIAINTDWTKGAANSMGLVENTYISNIIQHGTTHNAGIIHNNDVYEWSSPFQKDRSTGQDNVPDMSTGRNWYSTSERKSKFQEAINTAGDKLRSLYGHKFTNNKAKDNVFKKPIKD